MCKFLCGHMFSSLGHIPGSEMPGLSDYSTFSLLRSCQTVFQSSYTNLHSHQQCVRVLIYPHFHQHLLLSDVLLVDILLGMKCLDHF